MEGAMSTAQRIWTVVGWAGFAVALYLGLGWLDRFRDVGGVCGLELREQVQQLPRPRWNWQKENFSYV